MKWVSLQLTIYLVVLWAFLFECPAQVPNLHFNQITIEKGLSNARASCFLQDSRGFIWIGTIDGGLNRFDGYHLKIFEHDPDDPFSLGGNTVWSLLEDKHGNIWVGTGRGLNIYNRTNNTFRPILLDRSDSASVHLRIATLYQDRQEHIWIGSTEGSLFRFDGHSFTRFRPDGQGKNQTGVNHVSAVYEDKKGRLWVGTSFGLHRFRSSDSTFTQYPLFVEESQTQGNNMVTKVEEDSRGNLWIGTLYSGLYRLAQDHGSVPAYRYYDLAPGSRLGISDIHEDRSGNLWVSTDPGGLYIKEKSREEFRNFRHEPQNPTSLSDDILGAIFEDRDGGIWLGTRVGGINYWSPHAKAFLSYRSGHTDGEGLSYRYVTSFSERRDGKIWIGTDGGGVNLLDPAARTFEHFRHDPNTRFKLHNNKVISVLEDRTGMTWVATWGVGVFKFDAEDISSTFTHYLAEKSKAGSLSGPNIMHIFEDQSGGIWILAWGGLNHYQKDSDTFAWYLPDKSDPASLSSPYLNLGFADRNDHIWIGHNQGLDRLERSNKTFGKFLPGMQVNAICEDNEGNFWVGSGAGLVLLNREDGSYTVFTQEQGMPDRNVNGILEDAKGNLWISTNKGLTQFNPKDTTFRNYDHYDGLSGNQFSAGAYLKTSTGHLYFGGTNGFTSFHPDSIRDNPNEPTVAITDFQLFNRTLAIRGTRAGTLDEKSPLLQDISLTKEIVLKYWQNDINLEFAALNYLNPEKNQYKYRLEGYQEDWIGTPASRRFAQFTNLSPGTYTFRVIASNNDGRWNEQGTSLKIIITPPWWKTIWAYAAYVLMVLSLFFAARHYELSRHLAKAEARRLQELDAVKTKLYTNITHEFRTPLTVILGMADKMAEDPKKWFREGVELIKRNGRSLLTLVNQMLDLRKLESGRMPLQMVQGDIISHLKYLMESFHSFAEMKDIRLHFLKSDDPMLMDYDPGKLKYIVSNLLSNAIKFTPEGGDVYISAESVKEDERPEVLILKFRDTGIGIPPEKLPHIFDRFYQVDDRSTRRAEGTGIGLTLTRELVHLLKGDISVKSKPTQGTEFTIVLPITRQASKEDDVPFSLDEEFFAPFTVKSDRESSKFMLAETHSLPRALIIEDNKDVVRYLEACLEGAYQTDVAYNGREGIDRAIAEVPDIIISDVMMPEKDGFEVCNTLKHDERTSHIPIVLLTAKTATEDRIAGLKIGADAYLTKPFDKEELFVRLEKLIEIRQRLQARYQDLKPPASAPDEDLQKEDAFLHKVNKAIEAHLDNENFSIPQLCRAVNYSRPQLYHKLKALTGKSVAIYIRMLRLRKAQQLLQTTDLNVSEIAYEVGFKDPNYFVRTYRETFGYTPGQTRN